LFVVVVDKRCVGAAAVDRVSTNQEVPGSDLSLAYINGRSLETTPADVRYERKM